MKKEKVYFVAADAAECALFTALMVVSAFIEIPLPLMPLTLQTAMAVLAGLMLGWKKGMIATAAYAIMGLLGLPVFTKGGGFHYVMQPSFGYILGFIAAAGVAGIFYKKQLKLWQTVLLAIAATMVDYVFGMAYFAAVWQISGYAKLWESLVSYNIIFIPKDVILAILAAALSRAVVPAVKKIRKIKN